MCGKLVQVATVGGKWVPSVMCGELVQVATVGGKENFVTEPET